MIWGINESKRLTKHMSRECICKFDGRKCNSNLWCKSYKCWCECKKYNIYEKDYIWNPATCCSKTSKYLASITDDSVITYNEIISAKAKSNDEETKQFQWKKQFQQISVKKYSL